MENYKISVIIPCYNQGQYIDEAVESVLAQSYHDFEIIIINDGSTDEATNIKLIDYSRPKTRVIHTKNQGASAARNVGFKNAKGAYIQFLDADDIILPLKFEEQINIFNQFSDISICYTDYKIYDIGRENFLNLPPKKFLGENPLYDFLFKWERGISIPIHCALFKKEVWADELPFNERFKAEEDWLMWCKLALNGSSFYFLDKEYAYYRFHDDNKSKNKNEMYYSFFLVVFSLLQIIPEKYKEEFLMESILHNKKILLNDLHPEMVNQITDLKNKFSEMDKTIDYKIGNKLLKPYRFFKRILFGKQYL